MKCPVCDQESSTMLCPSCGFDASRDYRKYPTFAPVSGSSFPLHPQTLELATAVEHLYALIREWEERISSLKETEAKLREKDELIATLKERLRQTRAELYDAQEQIARYEAPPVESAVMKEEPVDPFEYILSKYTKTNYNYW